MACEVKKGAEAYRLDGNNGKAVLLIHGYTGAPGELRPLGDYLNSLGYTVLGIRLPGHGTCVEELARTTADDWFCEAERGINDLLGTYPGKVYVAGLSMGGLLTIRIAAKYPVCAAAIMSAPIFLPDKRLPFYPILKYFIKQLPKSKKDYGDMMKYNLSYDTMPTKPLGSLFEMLDNCKLHYIRRITCPSIVFQSTIEHTVVPKSAQYIYDYLACGKENKKLVWLYNSGHIVTLDKEREIVFREIGDFFAKY